MNDEPGVDLSQLTPEDQFLHHLMRHMHMCETCGALILNQDKHTEFHAAMHVISVQVADQIHSVRAS
jgi:hypothetical protein